MFRPIWPSSGFMSIKIKINIKPDDGHIWPKHVVLTLKNIHLSHIIRVVFLAILPPI